VSFFWSAAAVVGSTLVSASASRRAADKQASAIEDAGDLQLEAARESIKEQKRQFDIARQDLAPYRAAGEQALGNMRNMLSGTNTTKGRQRKKYGNMQADFDAFKKQNSNAAPPSAARAAETGDFSEFASDSYNIPGFEFVEMHPAFRQANQDTGFNRRMRERR